MTLRLEGDSNDYLGKGLCGGRIFVVPPKEATFTPEENIIVGNVLLYGATSGEVFIRGRAGERFCVRNSGANAVVEGVGDHGCEYMTGGRVVILGSTGRNFAAGMSGGIAYLWDPQDEFRGKCNPELVELDALEAPADIETVKGLLAKHALHTGSPLPARLLENWDIARAQFIKVIPSEYKVALERLSEEQSETVA